MIYNIEVGEWDSMANGLQVLSTLEGPDGFDIKGAWETFEGNYEGALGSYPQWQRDFTQLEEKGYQETVRLWNLNRDRINESLKTTWGVEENDFLSTRFFIKFLIKNHGFKEVSSYTPRWEHLMPQHLYHRTVLRDDEQAIHELEIESAIAQFFQAGLTSEQQLDLKNKILKNRSKGEETIKTANAVIFVNWNQVYRPELSGNDWTIGMEIWD